MADPLLSAIPTATCGFDGYHRHGSAGCRDPRTYPDRERCTARRAPDQFSRIAAQISVQIIPEDLRSRWMAQFAHGFRLDLANPLAGDAIDLADLIQRLRLPVSEPETHRHDTGLTLAQGVKDIVQLLLQQREAHGIRRNDRLGVLNQITEFRITVFTQRGVQRDRLTAVLLHLDDLLRGHV